MASSLDKLSSYLPSNKKKILHEQFNYLPNEQRHKLERKGVFCYEFMDSLEKLDFPRLPKKEDFYSSLSDSHISDAEYDFAQSVWSDFNIRSLGEYAELYMKTDILLLSDVFENFRDECQAIYSIDPAHHYTAAGFSWEAMLKYTKVEIELLTDIDMYMFIERGIRGGISQCSKRYACSNHKYIDYDTSKPTSYINYYDANNLVIFIQCFVCILFQFN